MVRQAVFLALQSGRAQACKKCPGMTDAGDGVQVRHTGECREFAALTGQQVDGLARLQTSRQLQRATQRKLPRSFVGLPIRGITTRENHGVHRFEA